MGIAVAALIFLAASGTPHDAEIQAFASTMAIARTVREDCPGIEPDEGVFEAMRQRLHVVEADHAAAAENVSEYQNGWSKREKALKGRV